MLILGLLMLGLGIEFVRDMFGTGDFVGYVNAGNNVLSGTHIYSDYLNTWPPLFSIFSVPLALIDNLNGVVMRGIWLCGMLVCLFWIMKTSVALILEKKLLLPFQSAKDEQSIPFHDLQIFIPFLLIFRFVLDNMANIQINVFMLGMTMAALNDHLKGKDGIGSFWLALSISLKVFTLFMIPYFLVRKKFKMVAYTLGWILLLNTLPFLVFGIDTTLSYYVQFFKERAEPFAMILHKNQSIFALFRSLFMEDSRGLDIYLNFMHLSVHQAKMLSYAIAGILVATVLLILNKVKQPSTSSFISETFIVMTALPIFSPLAWKAYFIFLWPSCFWICHKLLNPDSNKSPYYQWIIGLMIFFVVTTTFTTEAIVGSYLSDVTEVFACITIGTCTLLMAHLILHIQIFQPSNNE
jgi:hypothetical protein